MFWFNKIKLMDIIKINQILHLFIYKYLKFDEDCKYILLVITNKIEYSIYKLVIKVKIKIKVKFTSRFRVIIK